MQYKDVVFLGYLFQWHEEEGYFESPKIRGLRIYPPSDESRPWKFSTSDSPRLYEFHMIGPTPESRLKGVLEMAVDLSRRERPQ